MQSVHFHSNSLNEYVFLKQRFIVVKIYHKSLRNTHINDYITSQLLIVMLIN